MQRKLKTTPLPSRGADDLIARWEDPFRAFVLSRLRLWDLYRLAQSSKRCKQRVDDYLHQNSSISLTVDQFFGESNREIFLTALSLSEGVISGSMALSFFSRTVYERADMDIYVNVARTNHMLEGLTALGYRKIYAPDKRPYGPWGSTIVEVADFVNESGEKKIQVIQVSETPIAAVLRFHSTCVMNVITSTHAISFYPRATFVDRVNIACDVGPTRERSLEGTEKYRQRGWLAITDTHNAAANHVYPGVIRAIGDAKCWTVRHTNGGEEFGGLHTWSADSSPWPDSEEVYMSFALVDSHDMTRTFCVEGSINCFMQASPVHWTDATYRQMMKKLAGSYNPGPRWTSPYVAPVRWDTVVGHQHRNECKWVNDLQMERVCRVVAGALFGAPLWEYTTC